MTISMSGLDLSGIKWAPIEERPAKPRHDRRSQLACPQIISDNMEYTVNHADGQMYGSKRAYTKAVHRAGCDIVGNEKIPKPKPFKPEGIKKDLAMALRGEL